jgi:hypothetical protein
LTGYLVRNEDEAVTAVRMARELDRRQIRRRFDRRFSATTMARAYLDIYADRVARPKELAPERFGGEVAIANIA